MTTGELCRGPAWRVCHTCHNLSHVSAARVTARMPIVIGFVTRVTRVTRVTPVTEVSVAGSSESNRFRNGTAAGGFMCFIVRLIAGPFMSWSDTTPAPNVAGRELSEVQ